MEYKTKRGVYLDLSKSPWQYKAKDGTVLRFASEKKLQMFKSFVQLAGVKIDRAFDIAGDLQATIDTKTMLRCMAAVEKSIYKEGSESWRKRRVSKK